MNNNSFDQTYRLVPVQFSVVCIQLRIFCHREVHAQSAVLVNPYVVLGSFPEFGGIVLENDAMRAASSASSSSSSYSGGGGGSFGGGGSMGGR